LTAAAVHFYPKKNNLIIGLGTCITYNFINKYKEFVGGVFHRYGNAIKSVELLHRKIAS
jgi:pantothenate kinase type III